MYQLPQLSKMKGIAHGVSLRDDGNQSFRFDPRETVVLRRKRFVAMVHSSFILENGVALAPNHGDCEAKTIVVGQELVRGLSGRGMSRAGTGLRGEALITSAPNIYLYLLIADCIPIVIYAPIERVLALVHAGRVSSQNDIIRKTVRRMSSEFAVNPRTLYVGLGPGIRQESYVLETFPPAGEADSPWQEFCAITPEGIAVDLYGYNRRVLIEEGVPTQRIEDCGIDTFTDKRFFSHRRSFDTGELEGRQACVVSMVAVE